MSSRHVKKILIKFLKRWKCTRVYAVVVLEKKSLVHAMNSSLFFIKTKWPCQIRNSGELWLVRIGMIKFWHLCQRWWRSENQGHNDTEKIWHSVGLGTSWFQEFILLWMNDTKVRLAKKLKFFRNMPKMLKIMNWRSWIQAEISVDVVNN